MTNHSNRPAKTVWALGALASAAGLSACGGSDDPLPAPVQPAAVACADLATYKVASVNTIVASAEPVNASASAPFTSPNGGGGSATVTQPFCRVTGSVQPSASSDIRFELWLPPAATWNEKFAGTASGGSNGYISYGTVNLHLSMGYASVGHDNGHSASDANFALNADRKIDFAYRAQHVVTQVGKELTQAFYAAASKHAYYNGCSQGGHHGIMEMNRYPGDYDGIIAGAPASDWTGTLAAEGNAALAQWGTAGSGIPKTLQAEVRRKVIETCDGKPGVDPLLDGVLDDPRQCHFDPAVMQCGMPTAKPSLCLSAPQVQALRLALDGRRKSTGESVALGYEPDAIGGIFFPTDLTSPANPQGSWSNHWRYAVFENPAYDFTTFNWDTDVDFARGKEGPTYDTVTGDFSAFADRGGKFLMYHGWADSLITPALSLDTWSRMRAQMGTAKVASFARLYMVPGMDHCGGGTGTSNFQLLTALSNWVEKGIPPDGTSPADTTIASRTANADAGVVARTRPLCPYPKAARYIGSGDINDAANFICAP